MKKFTANSFSILLLNKAHKRKDFTCGVGSLDDYFHKRAGQAGRKHIAVNYVLYDKENSQIAGYYTLSAATLELIALPEKIRKKLPSYPCLPATLIGRLAIDLKYRNKGLGEVILIDALKRAHSASLDVASFTVLVDAINESAKQFYKKYGFLDLSVSQRRLYLPMKTIADLFSAKATTC